MVSQNDVDQVDKVAARYALSDVHRLAKANDMHFAGSRRLLQHLAKMGFPQTGDDRLVCDVLGMLKTSHFRQSETYVGFPHWHDVYVYPGFEAPNGCDYNLYIKLRLMTTGQKVILCSFHPEGWK